MKHKVLILALLLAGLGSVGAQGTTQAPQGITPRRADLHRQAMAILDEVGKGNFAQAMSILQANSTIAPAEINNLTQTLSSQNATIIQAYGRSLSFIPVVDKELGGILYQVQYLNRREGYPLNFQITWYLTQNGWKIVNFFYDDKILDLLTNLP